MQECVCSVPLNLRWPVTALAVEYHKSNVIWRYSVTGSIATFIHVLVRDLKRNRNAEASQSPAVHLLSWRTLVWGSLGATEPVEQTPRWVQRPESLHGRKEMTEPPHQALLTLGDPHPRPLRPLVSVLWDTRRSKCSTWCCPFAARRLDTQSQPP